MSKNAKNTKPINNRNRFSSILSVILFVFSICALLTASFIYYEKRYLTLYWVDGQSMYPTLNKDAIKPNGEPCGVDGGNGYAGLTHVDCVAADCHEAAKKTIKRFDIVIANTQGEDEAPIIKRVVGLPGETIKFNYDAQSNVVLTIKDGNEYEKIEQNFAPKEYLNAGSYPFGDIKLGSDEYYLLGDNRANSADSRSSSVGNVKYSCIIGKVILRCGYGEVYKNDESTTKSKLDIKNIVSVFPEFI